MSFTCVQLIELSLMTGETLHWPVEHCRLKEAEAVQLKDPSLAAGIIICNLLQEFRPALLIMCPMACCSGMYHMQCIFSLVSLL